MFSYENFYLFWLLIIKCKVPLSLTRSCPFNHFDSILSDFVIVCLFKRCAAQCINKDTLSPLDDEGIAWTQPCLAILLNYTLAKVDEALGWFYKRSTKFLRWLICPWRHIFTFPQLKIYRYFLFAGTLYFRDQYYTMVLVSMVIHIP